MSLSEIVNYTMIDHFLVAGSQVASKLIETLAVLVKSEFDINDSEIKNIYKALLNKGIEINMDAHQKHKFKGGAKDFFKNSIGRLQAYMKEVDDTYQVPKAESGGCYLTTACVEQRGLPDDCDELTTLRLFRDGYMRTQPGGEEDILEYYEKAPKIVDVISKQNNKSEVYDYIYSDVIVPCVEYIKNGENEEAYEIYRSMVKELETKYLS